MANPTITTQKLKDVSLSLTVLYAYLDNAFWSGLLSQMNSSVIQKEIRASVNLISQLDQKYRNTTNPQNSFLTLLEKNPASLVPPVVIKDTNVPIKDAIKDNLKDIIKDTTKDNNQERVSKIKGLLRDFKPRNVKDIASLFPEVSEKTIQREINRLIGQGIIKRIGDRRWSTYILV